MTTINRHSTIADERGGIMKLKEAREARGLSQGQLAKASKVDVRSIQAYEQGLRDISKASVKTVIALAKVLGVTAEDLVE